MSEEDIYRKEALEHYQKGAQRQGTILRISPRWLNAAFWVLCGFGVVAVFFVSLARVNEYATGPAVIRALGRTELTARSEATVGSIDASSFLLYGTGASFVVTRRIGASSSSNALL